MYNDILACAEEAARKAGALLKAGFGTTFDIKNKEGRNNLVTEYDHKSEKLIIDLIKTQFPDHNILAEESGYSGNEDTDTIRWIIDPLDGTVNFAHAIPIFSISIAAELKGEILCGVIYHPLLDEMFTTVKGGGSYMNGKKITVSSCEDMESSILVTGFPYNVNQNPNNCLGKFTEIVGHGIPIRRLGSAALDLAYVAMGRFDGFWEVSLKPWDVAAGILLVQEAGGSISQFNLKEYKLSDHTLLASNGKIQSQMANVLCDLEK